MGITSFRIAAVLVLLSIGLVTRDLCGQEARSGGDKGSFSFRDDFTGSSLRPEWTVLNEDPDRWTLLGGEELLLVSSWRRSDQIERNRFVYSGRLPKDWEIEVRTNSGPSLSHVYFAVRIERDKGNLLAFEFSGRGSVLFQKVLKGESSGFRERINVNEDQAYYLKIRKRDVEYTALFSLDGTAWTEVGTHIFLKLDGSPNFGTYTTFRSGPEIRIKVDYFEIREIR